MVEHHRACDIAVLKADAELPGFYRFLKELRGRIDVLLSPDVVLGILHRVYQRVVKAPDSFKLILVRLGDPHRQPSKITINPARTHFRAECACIQPQAFFPFALVSTMTVSIWAVRGNMSKIPHSLME